MDDMSELIKQFSAMIEKDGIPDNLKDIAQNLANSNKSESPKSEPSSTSSGFDGIDIATLIKMKSIMDELNSKDDPRTNLLLSLKPYLKDSRKSKIDQYMQFLNMSKIFDMFKNSGGDLK